MMKIKLLYIPFLVSVLLFPTYLQAQETKKESAFPEEITAWTKSTLDSLSYKHYRSLKEAMIDNDFYIPLAFRGGMFTKPDLSFNKDSVMEKDIPKAYNYVSKKFKYFLRHYKFKKSLEDNAYKNVMLKNPQNFKYSKTNLPQKSIKHKIIEQAPEVKLTITDTKTTPEVIDPVIKFIPDRKYWTSNAELSLKLTQSKLSDNWYKGGNDFLSIYGRIVLYYNYAKNKTKLNNTLDASALLYNAPNDSLRNYRVGSDVLRFTSQFGYKAFGKWDYASSLTFTTQMFNSYTENTNNKLAGFLAPFKIDLTVGMKYTYVAKPKKKDRAFTFPISIDPLAFMYMQSQVDDMDLARHGFPKNDDGTTFKTKYHTLGSSLKIDRINAKFNKNCSMTWRLYYFTNYERILAESETNFDFQISKFFAASINIYLRYDDAVAKINNSYLQYYELLSFGFNYKW